MTDKSNELISYDTTPLNRNRKRNRSELIGNLRICLNEFFFFENIDLI